MPVIHCQAKLFLPGSHLGSDPLLSLPKDASTQLPSRGMTMVQGTINGTDFRAVLEPDGKGSHWFRVGKQLREITNIKAGDTVTLIIEPSKEWREPRVPAELQRVLNADPEALAVWQDITAMARWDWIRWLGAPKLAQTRQRRIDTICSRLKAGKRRPCCFDRTQCTLTDA